MILQRTTIFVFFLLVTLQVRGADLIPAHFPELKVPNCFQNLKSSEIKDFIFTFTELLKRENTKNESIQKNYSEGLSLYTTTLLKPNLKSDRLCLLSVLLALFETPHGTAAPELLAEWYNNKITNDKQEVQFRQDIDTIKDKNDPKDFADKIISKLDSFSSIDL